MRTGAEQFDRSLVDSGQLPHAASDHPSRDDADIGRYTVTARTLHWTIAAMIAGMYVTNWMRSNAPQHTAERLWWLSAHESLGLAVLVLSLGRLAWRLTHPAPPLHGSPSNRIIAHAGHALLYLGTIGLPIAGIARALAGSELEFFGTKIGPSARAGDVIFTVTEFLHGAAVTDLFLALIAGHAVAALWHQYVVKDGTLRRMI